MKDIIIAEGIVRFKNYIYEVDIGDLELADISEKLGEMLEGYSGKKVKLILKESK